MNTEEFANRIRKLCVTVAHGEHNVHIGGSLSEADILAVLYNDVLNVDKNDPHMETRDRMVLSKGHSCSGLYAALAIKGFISEEEMLTQYQDGTRISGHISHHVEGIEISTGSLGHGMPIATGMAMAAKLDEKKHRVFTLVGDGECEEGAIYEAVNFAGKRHLNNLVCIVDSNGIQSGTHTDNYMNYSQLVHMFKNAGWLTIECDGHDTKALRQALYKKSNDQPLCVIAHTVKGKGVSFMENNPAYHSNKLNDEQYKQAMEELGGAL